MLRDNYYKTRAGSCLARITTVAQSVFKAIAWFFTFPFRYIGSKSWSIPGVILRTPIVLFHKICGRNISLYKELFRTAYRSHFDKTLTPKETAKLLPYCAVTAFLHNEEPEWILPFGFEVISPKSLPSLPNHPSIQPYEHAFLGLSSLKVSLVEKGDEIIIGFGAMKAHETIVGKNKDIHRNQLWNVGQNYIGLKPSLYKQADAFIQDLLQLPRFKDKKITLVGCSLAGSLASYVGIKHRFPTYCFNSVALGAGLQDSLPQKNLKDADQFVTHLSVPRDFTSDSFLFKAPDLLLSGLGIRTPGNFGKRFVIPTPYRDSCEKHGFIFGSMMHHLGYGNRGKPHEMGNNHPLIQYLREHLEFDLLPKNVQWQLKFTIGAKYVDDQLMMGHLFDLEALTLEEVEILLRVLTRYYNAKEKDQPHSIYPHLLALIKDYRAQRMPQEAVETPKVLHAVQAFLGEEKKRSNERAWKELQKTGFMGLRCT